MTAAGTGSFRIGVQLPEVERDVSWAEVRAMALRAEDVGFDSLWVGDHLLYRTPDGTPRGPWEAWSQLAALAAVTTRVELGPLVAATSFHAPAMIAKKAATIDEISGGRLILGVGSGWMKEEFGLLGAPFEDRGRATDEYIEAFKELWTKDRPAYSGRHVNFADVIFAPKPVQKPHPPIWVGGESPAALRRTIKLGDCWYPGNNSQTKPLDTPARLGAAIAHLHGKAEAAGRDPASVDVCLLIQNPFDWTTQKIADGSARRLFTGSSADMAADAAALEAVGVRHVAMRLGGSSLQEALEHIDRFGREVIGRA